MLMHELTPSAIGKDHEFSNDFIQGGTAFTLYDGHHFIFNVKIKINAVGLFRL